MYIYIYKHVWRPLSGRIEITLKTGEQPIMDKEKRSDVDSKTGRKTSIGWVKPMVSCHIWGFAKLGFWMIWSTPFSETSISSNMPQIKPLICVTLNPWCALSCNGAKCEKTTVILS